MTSSVQPKSRLGFASMDPQRQREIASLGGKTSHQNGAAHEFTPETAKAAAIKSGQQRTINAGKRKTLTLGTSSSAAE